MARLAVSKTFLEGYAKLGPRLKNKVAEHADTFARLSANELRTLKGLHLERHTGAVDPRARTIRITDNFRGIVFDAGNDDLFVLMMIGTHDETDRWMAKNTFGINEATGAFEVYNVEAVEAELAAVPTIEGAAPLFDHRRDKDFVQLGISSSLLPTLRAFTDEEQLLGLLAVLPQVQSDALIELISEETVEKIYSELVGQTLTAEPVDTEDMAAAITAPVSRSTYKLLENQEELSEVLGQPLAHWKIFLHPFQVSLVEKDYNGPARITGGAGTGKTVVAIHRARHLMRQLPADNTKAILFTTYTRNLAQAIESDLRNLGGTALLDRIDVINIDRVAYRIVQEAEGSPPKPIGADDAIGLWQQVIDDRGLRFTPSFLNAEWEQVVLAQNLTSRSEYFKAARVGRGTALDRRSRAEVWKAIEGFTKALDERGGCTWLQLAEAAAGHVQRRSVKPYQHVVVDEAQDLHEAQWRLIRALADEGPNDLFVAGDTHQRIYDRRSSLSKVGIEVRGRSRKLKINYRTTHEILVWSLAILGVGDFSFDDLDGGADTHDFAGYHSYRHGPKPIMSGHKRSAAQMSAMAKQVKNWVDGGVPQEEIGIAARSRGRSFDRILKALAAEGIDSCVLPTDVPRAVGVRIGTMHRMKGLEFTRVAIVDLTDEWFPEPLALSTDDQAQRAADLQREACLLYVAATRARDELWVGWHDEPSRFLGPVLSAD